MLPTDFAYDPKLPGISENEADKPALSPCEIQNATYLKNMDSSRFKEPRMFTMRQIRNMIFACVNQSTIAQRLGVTETRHDKLDLTCEKLDETDKKLKEQAEINHNELTEKIKKWKQDFSLLQKQNVRRFEEHDTNLENHSEVL